MVACVRIKLGVNRPAGSTAPEDIDLVAAILADASFQFWGDETTFAQSAGKVTAWNSRGGANSYSQATSSKQPNYNSSGGLANKAWADFTGTADANGSRMSPSWAAFAVTQPLTVVDVLKTDTLSGTRYMDGRISSGDDIAGFVSPAAGGIVCQRWGSAQVTVPIAIETWRVVARSYDGAGAVEIQSNGTIDSKTGATPPTTPRLLTLGAISDLADAGVWDGGFQARMVFRKSMASDRNFFRNIVGEQLRAQYSLSTNPIITP